MNIIVQIWVEADKDLTSEQLVEIYGQMNIMCSKVENFGFVHCQMCVDQKVYEGRY